MDYIDSLQIEGINYGISQLKDEGVNNITTLSGIPIDKRMIYATLSENITEISVNSGMTEGEVLIIVCNPTIDIKILISGSKVIPITEDNSVIVAKKGELFLITITKRKEDYIIDTTGKVINSLGFVEEVNPGDVLVWNNLFSTLGFITYNQLCSISEDDRSLYTPIGICAIPSNHNVYGDGKVGVLGLEEAEKSWGDSSVDTGLKNYSNITLIDEASGELIDTSDSSLLSLFPSEIFYDMVSSDGVTGYINPNKHRSDSLPTLKDVYYAYIPSPFNSDGSRNFYYYSDINHNILSDFNGKKNTEILCSLGSIYGAATWCNSYSVTIPNSSPIDGWYLPSAGEIGYVNNRVRTINNSIEKISEVFNKDLRKINIYDLENEKKSYWTSTETSESHPIISTMGLSILYNESDSKEDNHLVRPFLQIDPRQKLPSTVRITFSVVPGDTIIRYSINTEDYDQVLEYNNDSGNLILGTGRLGFNTLE